MRTIAVACVECGGLTGHKVWCKLLVPAMKARSAKRQVKKR